MRVLHTVAEMGRGGAERMLLVLVEGLLDAGHGVTLAAAPGPLDGELPPSCIRWLLPAPSRSLPHAVQVIAGLARAVREARPDVVHAHNVRIGGLASLAVRATPPGRPRPSVLVTFHGVFPEEYRAAARILRLADHVAAVSRDAASRLGEEGLPRRRLSIVHNVAPPPAAVDPAALEGLDAELDLDAAPVVAIVGRLVPQKVHERFLAAAAAVHRHRPEVRFLVIGDGPLRASLEERTVALGLAGAVRFTGQRADVATLLRRIDLLVFSSDWEGLSVAALEALAAGVPVVSTPVEGMSELLENGAGIVVAQRRPEPLAEAVVELLDDPARRAAMGAAGRRIVAARFTPEAMVGAYQDLYRALA